MVIIPVTMSALASYVKMRNEKVYAERTIMKTAAKQEDENSRAALNVVLVGLVYLATALWLVTFFAGGIGWLRNVLRPHIPSWLLLANLLLVPVTGALVGLRSIGFRKNLCVFPIFLVQVSMIGLSGEHYPIVESLVMIFLLYETFMLVPGWNRRFLEAQRGHSVLGLEDKNAPESSKSRFQVL
jgi:hypothetical protein